MIDTKIILPKLISEQKTEAIKRRPTVGDLVRVRDIGHNYSRVGPGQTGRITTDDGSKQPYRLNNNSWWYFDYQVELVEE